MTCMTMNKEEAFRALEEQKKRLLARIPGHAPLLRTRYLVHVVEEEAGAAQNHLQVLYESGLAVGADFAGLSQINFKSPHVWGLGVRIPSANPTGMSGSLQ